MKLGRTIFHSLKEDQNNLLVMTSKRLTFVVCDGDFVGLPCVSIRSSHIQDSVCIDVKGDHNLRDPTRCGRDAGQLEFTQ